MLKYIGGSAALLAACRQRRRSPEGAAQEARPKRLGLKARERMAGSARPGAHGWKRMARRGQEARPKPTACEAKIQPRATGDPDAELEELSRAGRVRRSMQTSKRSAERDATQNSRSSDVRQDEPTQSTHTTQHTPYDTPDADLKRSVVRGSKKTVTLGAQGWKRKAEGARREPHGKKRMAESAAPREGCSRQGSGETQPPRGGQPCADQEAPTQHRPKGAAAREQARRSTRGVQSCADICEGVP
jgi:hypothetical protein